MFRGIVTRSIIRRTTGRLLPVRSRIVLPSLQSYQRVQFYSSKSPEEADPQSIDPQRLIAFTCKVCNTRSAHSFSDQAYRKGTVAIQCPGCKNRHLIADNLNIFRDHKYNIEEALKAKGESITTATEITGELQKALDKHERSNSDSKEAEAEANVEGLPDVKKIK
ncbi:DNL zinc finger-domain-containing protein [Scheffersomyces amazonensis]|uniref:DNL zinc finger-domain-containing protein n=1 Tax=Scheffersomyces amazonensis TaxID=1078765 RepID=UPI00315DAB6A